MRRIGTWVLTTMALFGFPATARADDALDPFLFFAVSLQASSDGCDLAALDASISVEDLMQRGTEGLTVSPQMQAGFVAGFRSKLSLGGEICASLQGSGSYKLLGLRRVDGQVRALFRMISNSGLNYHDYLLARGASSDVRIVDFYNYLSGEWFSLTLRRAFLPLIAESNRNPLDRLTGGENAYVRNVRGIARMQELMAEGHFAEALEIFDGFPPELKQDKNVLLLRFRIAALSGDLAYKAAMLDLKEQFPGDPALEFMLIDHYYYGRQLDQALAVIDSIDRKVDGDPYLDFLRANIYYTDGRYAEAKRAAQRAIGREPDLPDPYWTLVSISLAERDHAETARLLTAVESELGLAIGNLADLPDYADFLQSEAYRGWLEKR